MIHDNPYKQECQYYPAAHHEAKANHDDCKCYPLVAGSPLVTQIVYPSICPDNEVRCGSIQGIYPRIDSSDVLLRLKPSGGRWRYRAGPRQLFGWKDIKLPILIPWPRSSVIAGYESIGRAQFGGSRRASVLWWCRIPDEP